MRVLTLNYPHQKTPSQFGQRGSSVLSSSGSTFLVFPFAFSPFVFTTFRNAVLMTLVNSKITVTMPVWVRFNFLSIILNYSNWVCSNSSWVLACLSSISMFVTWIRSIDSASILVPFSVTSTSSVFSTEDLLFYLVPPIRRHCYVGVHFWTNTTLVVSTANLWNSKI